MILSLSLSAALIPVPVAAREQPQATSDWASVRRAQGCTVTVTRRSAETIHALVAAVDQSRMVVVTPGNAVSTSDWTDTLRRAESRWDAVAMGTERVTGRGGREISRDGLFQRGQKIASWMSIPREDILKITTSLRKRGSVRGLVVGGVVGGGIGVAMLYGGAFMNDGRGGGDVLMAAAPIVPAVGAAIGYFGFTHEEPFVYVAATASTAPLDDEAWRRILGGLPASLRGGAGDHKSASRPKTAREGVPIAVEAPPRRQIH